MFHGQLSNVLMTMAGLNVQVKNLNPLVSYLTVYTFEMNDSKRKTAIVSGTVWTASAHIITAVIGSGVLSLAWAIGQLGWIAGPTVMLLFSFVTYYSSTLLSDCYRTGDPVSGKRNYTYMDAVRSILGINYRLSVFLCICFDCSVFGLFLSVLFCFTLFCVLKCSVSGRWL